MKSQWELKIIILPKEEESFVAKTPIKSVW